MHTRDFRRPRGRGWLLALCLSSGCTTIPPQFEAYRQACAAARAQSEVALADHEAARRMKAALRTPAAEEAAADQPLSQRLHLSGLDVALDPLALDVQARLDAWSVVQRYNDALLALSTGASSAELEGAVNGLLDSLKEFPLAAVTDAAVAIAPYGPAVQQLLGLVQREVEARRFRDAVLAAE